MVQNARHSCDGTVGSIVHGSLLKTSEPKGKQICVGNIVDHETQSAAQVLVAGVRIYLLLPLRICGAECGM